MSNKKELVYLDLFDDGHHFEHAIHLLQQYVSSKVIKGDSLSVCVTDSLVERLKQQLEKLDSEKYPVFIPLDDWQKKLINYRNTIKSKRYKLFISNILDIYTIIRLNKVYKQKQFLINVVNNMTIPLLFFQLFFSKVKIAGIYFNPLYRSKYAKGIHLSKRYRISILIDELKLFLFSKINVLTYIFILGDKSLVRYYNNKYKSTKFVYLGDPFYFFDSEISALSITPNEKKITVLSFGALQRRKGIFLIMEAILSMDINLLNKFHFKFIGKVDKDDWEKLCQIKQKIEEHGRGQYMTLIDSYVEYEELARAVSSSDIIYAGYESYGASSGVLIWSAFFRKPLICIRKSLIGKSAEYCEIALLMDGYFTEDLISILSKTDQIQKEVNSEIQIKDFLFENSASNFAKTLFAHTLIN